MRRLVWFGFDCFDLGVLSCLCSWVLVLVVYCLGYFVRVCFVWYVVYCYCGLWVLCCFACGLVGICVSLLVDLIVLLWGWCAFVFNLFVFVCALGVCFILLVLINSMISMAFLWYCVLLLCFVLLLIWLQLHCALILC